jgi:hypothetical protein
MRKIKKGCFMNCLSAGHDLVEDFARVEYRGRTDQQQFTGVVWRALTG